MSGCSQCELPGPTSEHAQAGSATFGGQFGNSRVYSGRPRDFCRMEGLRTKLDGLQWEVNRLEVENRRLREGDAEASVRVDLEGELERSKAELAQMAARVEESAAQAADQAQAAERRARETEELAGHQEQALEEIRTRLQETVEELRVERRESTAVRNTLAASEERSGALEEELARLEDELRTKSEEVGRQRAALELERYRWMEETTKKSEARESRLLDQLDKMGRTHAGGGDNAVLCEQLQEKLVLVTEEVHSYEGVVGELKAENEGLRLAREELKAELAFAWARVQRLEGRGAKEPDVGGKGGLQTGLLPTPGPDENGTYNPVSSESHAHCTQAPAFPQSNAALVHDSGPMFTTNSSMMPAAYQSMSRPSGAQIPTCMLSDPTHASVVVVPSATELSPVRAGVVATPGRQTPATAVLGRRVSTPPLQAASVSAAAALVPTQMSPMASIRPRPQWGGGGGRTAGCPLSTSKRDICNNATGFNYTNLGGTYTWSAPVGDVSPDYLSAAWTLHSGTPCFVDGNGGETGIHIGSIVSREIGGADPRDLHQRSTCNDARPTSCIPCHYTCRTRHTRCCRISRSSHDNTNLE